MADKDGLYTIKIKGENEIFEFRGSEQHGLEVICHMLSDLTAYKGEYLRDEILARMNINEQRKVTPAAMGGWGEIPVFLIKRVA